MKKEEKDTMVEYMMKHCGYSYCNALKKFNKLLNDKISLNEDRDKPKRKIAENKEMSKDQMDTMIIYMHKQGFTNTWIAESLGILSGCVNKTIRKYRSLITNRK